nr:arsenosugar biosynthesis-associated peroxidase-like protein [Neolewinella agarilytica]
MDETNDNMLQAFSPTEFTLGSLSGPLLIFGGAYSNLEALTALRAEAERKGIPPENVICCGDTPGYCADPAACLDLIEDWGIHAIAGNVETNLVNGTDDCGCGFGDGSRCDMFARLWYNYAANNVTARNLEYMAGLPDLLRFTYAGREVVVLHGSPRNQSEFVWRSTDADQKAQFCAAAGAEVVIGGHCGLPFAEEITITAPRSADTSDELLADYVRPKDASDERLAERSEPSHAVAQSNIANRHSHIAYPSPLWLNAGVIGMPANDGTPRTWFMTLDDTNGFDYEFHALDYNHQGAKARMLDDRRLPVSYAATLTTGIWDNTEIMPSAEEAREGVALDPETIKAEASAAFYQQTLHPAAAPTKARLPLKNITKMEKYSDPKDLKSFGKIVDWQEDMGNKFFDWYSGVTEGDSALTEREKALIALAVSHAIQCSYCIDAYTTNSLQAGADEEQMMEAVHVAAAVKAGTTLIYARQMQRQVEKVVM